MDKKNPHRFTIKFNPNIPKQKVASDLLNSRPDKASYLATTILQYEQAANTSFTKESPALVNIFNELQKINQLLTAVKTSDRSSAITQFDKTSPTKINSSEKEILKDMFAAFKK